MGPSGAALGTLILRCNELQSLHGLEQLRNLRHLDVAYNLLERHRELSPLWLLAELRKLCLEGNPLWFHPEHRAATARCLSPRARDAAAGFLLDGKALSLTDFQTSPSSGLGPMASPLPWPVGSTTETSGGPDLSDSPSSGGVVAQPPVRKVKSRVRVRRASISEPSDTDPEPRTLDPSPAGRFVQQHRELELMNSFRDRFGRDWLQYRSHLEASGAAALGTRPPDAPSPEAVRGPPPPEKGSPQEEAEAVRVEPEPQEEEELEEGEEEGGKEEEEEEQSELEGECSLAARGRPGRGRCLGARRPQGPSLGLSSVELCRPMLVCPLEGPEGLRGRECFLWVTAGHLFEVELQAARTLERLELQSLEAAEIEAETQTQSEPVPEGSDPHPAGPVLVLRFSYICPDRQLRRYVVLEPDAQAAVQELLAVLTPAATLGKHQLGEARDPPGGRLQCLRCGHEFKPEEPRSGLDGEEGWRPLFRKTAPERCGLRSVDHRLRLFLDVEVFTDAQEEFQCCLKVPLVLAGHPGEFLCLAVVSDHRLYVLKVTGEIRGPPAGWLQPTLAIPLQDLSSIELGLAGQSLRLEWAAGAGGCVLLPRDARHCRAFLEELTDVLQSLPPTRRSSVSATEEEVTPKHRLWPLLETDPSLEPLRFFYLRAFLVEGPSTCPVSLLLTLSTLYLLDEDPIGSQAEPPLAAASGEASEKAPAPGPGPAVRVREQQPLSSLSSVLLYRGAPDDLRLVFYDEVSRLESFWALHVVCPEQLTALLAWIREPWEELFSIGLRTVTQEALDLDQ
eukprot:bmy_13395T0